MRGARRAVAAVLTAAVVSGTAQAASAAPANDPPANAPLVMAISVSGSTLVDGYGREVVLRGFNVSGEVKLEENGGLPFASTADALKSATAMRRLTGANAVRFLLSWAHAQPSPGQLDAGYLSRLTEQLKAFLDQGFVVIPDFHQDLYSRYLFNADSWYTGDGAPQWVVAAGNYPQENCGVCVTWGQNMTQNAAVQDATYDFWHNRVLTTQAGKVGVQDAFLDQAQGTLAYLKQHLSANEFAGLAGINPFNEPYAGRYDSGQNSQIWERDVLWPFYQRFRQRMDAAGWQDKPAFVEPNVLWNANLFFLQQPGGFLDASGIGPRFVFNSHFYDEAAQSGVLMPGKAGDGQYVNDFGKIRDRATALSTAAIGTEFGHPLSGSTSDKAPTVDKAMYQALDSRLPGANWWTSPTTSGSVLSGTQWHWDIYSGQHHELMNGNPNKVQTAGDAWNGEDFSSVNTNSAGNMVLRQDQRLLDRIYPNAVAGHVLAFTYEDRSRDGAQVLTWNPVPSSLPATAALVGAGQYGVVVWRSSGAAVPTELHLPQSFPLSGTTVISDLGTATGLLGQGPISASTDRAGAQRLTLSAPSAGALHYALITNGAAQPSQQQRTAAQAELNRWAAAARFPS